MQQKHPGVLVTGANGFVGREVCRQLLGRGFPVTAAVRKFVEITSGDAQQYGQVVVGELETGGDWVQALQGVQVVIHLAARVHVMQDTSSDPLAEFRQVNVAATERLARAAAAQGIKRLVFLSSVKVHGEQTEDAPFNENDALAPQDAYSISKWEAEQALHRVAHETGLEVVILRPPLIYGPGVKANFLRLIQWVGRGVPLPLASVKNRRSLLYLGNMVDALVTCVDHPAVAGNTYLLSDGEDVSTPELMCRIAGAFGKTPRLWPFPQFGLRMLGALAGKVREVERLIGSLQVDSGKFHRDTGWVPPYSLTQGIQETVDWYRRGSI